MSTSTRATTVSGPGDLTVSVERFLRPAADQRGLELRRLVGELTTSIDTGNFELATQALRSVISPTLDYTTARSLCRICNDLQGRHSAAHPVSARLAVLGSFTTKQLIPLIELHLFAAGVRAEIYEADYSVFRQEIFDADSELYEFGPQFVLLGTTWRDLAHRPRIGTDAATVARLLEAEWSEWNALWETLHTRSGCQVIQNNFVPPAWRSAANHEPRMPGSLGSYIASMNQRLAERAPSFVTVHDADHLAACWGRWSWDDPRFVHQAKMPCTPEALVDYAHSAASIVAAHLGLAKKCLVLDLDNTLWGGVIGDDGLGGIRLGQGEPEDEAYLAFQQYIKGLRMRGVILAVCSKNNDATAREVFEKHPEMVLRLDDISCFVANWNDKAANLRLIAERLNIGLNSLVFVDDNPAERAIVRRLVPEVAVPELPDDVTGYVEALERERYFQVLSVGAEDLARTDFYRADEQRREVESSSHDMRSFLASLAMVARVAPIDATSLERSVQLIQRSNQFNLTTRRRAASEMLPLMEDPQWITRTVSLADRFGDNGLISVLLARVSEGALVVDTWLMSCRVLKRGVEQFLLNHLCHLARERGLRQIRGEYIPTPKNSLVADHYGKLGFAARGSGREGQSYWELDLDGWQPFETEIREAISNECAA
jgi:FkbH-like protein